MKFPVTVSALVGTAALLAACSNDASAPSAAEMVAVEADAVPASAEITPEASSEVTLAREPLSKDAPAFASLYPQAQLNQPVVIASENGSEGGIAEFTTIDTPEMVIDHYRLLADRSGLLPVMAMNQGSARAFAAKSNQGAELQVVASPAEDGQTSVQLTWQAAN